MLNKFKEFLNSQKKFIGPAILVILAVLLAAFFYFQQRGVPRQEYRESYRLVPEKISKSAAIPIFLPPKTDKAKAIENISFEPAIEGKWLVQENKKNILASVLSNALPETENAVYFRPDSELNLNRHYSVRLAMAGEVSLSDDFLATEDPEIIGIFPAKDSEAPELSEITIIFNRPMVPLTTLGYLEEKEVPVEITPKTPGRFKWITTRNLQFIPETRLQRSSNYQVKIKSGLISMDGLEVKGTTNNFYTRKLRYAGLSQGQIIYNQPIAIHFNQPVDLEKIKKEMSLTNVSGQNVSFVAQHAEEEKGADKPFWSIENWKNLLTRPLSETKSSSTKDQALSTILIYKEKDRFGREKLWDFNESYSLKINKAYPLEGDIILGQTSQTSVNVSGVIENITATSERTGYARQNFFDPQGKLLVSFYEEIDLEKSEIRIPKLNTIAYAKDCKDKDQAFYNPETCEKADNKKVLEITFKGQEVGLGETLEINFERVVNAQSLTINKDPVKVSVVSYPKFKILKTFPSDNSQDASVRDFIICSNSPLKVPAKEDFKKYLKADLDYTVTYWPASYLIDYIYSGSNQQCDLKQFYTSISYGLMPRSRYLLELNLEDVFGQKASRSLEFATGDIPSAYLNFYHFQKDYSVTSPSKTKLTYAIENMEYVNIDICKLSAHDFLRYTVKRPKYSDSPETLTGCQERIAKTIELPQKFWWKNYFQVDIKDYFEDQLGYYIVTFSHPNYRTSYWVMENNKWLERKGQLYERTHLNVTNLGVAEKRIQPETAFYGTGQPLTEKELNSLRNLYWVTNLADLTPVSGVKVSLYQGDDLSPAGSFLTNDDGVAETKVVAGLRGAIIANGQDSTVIPQWGAELNWASLASVAKRIYLYTDKPIYRPGQEVFVKGIMRLGYDGNYEIWRDKKIDFKAYNSRGEEIFGQNLEVSDFGTFDAKILLDNNAPLGSYRVCADQFSCILVDVQEYQASAFQVEMTANKEEYISKDIASLEIQANYYFGVPLEKSRINYTFSSQDYYFDRFPVSGEYFRVGPERDYWLPYSYNDRFLFRGETELEQGKAKISSLLDLAKLLRSDEKPQSKIIVVDATLTNPQGQSVSIQKSFILHAGEFYLGISSDKYFLGKNEEAKIKIKAVDVQGAPKRVGNINLNVYKIDWIYSKRQEATGGYGYKWEKKKELVKQYNFSTDGQGEYIQPLKLSKEGEYEIEASARDSKENSIVSSYNIYVWGEGQVSVRPTEGTDLEVRAEKTNLKVGEEATVIIKSPYVKATALISIERGRIFDYQIKEIEGSLSRFSFKIEKEYVPNVFVSVLLQSSTPEVKFGKAEFKVDTETKELEISVKANKTNYLPGEEVSLDIETKDAAGSPAESELSIAVVDLSVLALKGNPKKDPLVFFYDGFPLTVSASSNLKNILVETEIVKSKGGSGLASEAPGKKARGVFRETAFWQAVVRTDVLGKANVRFTLPDNLTTWQTETIGLTKDTKLGVNYQEFMVRKELMIVPIKPRFTVPGDKFFIGAKIFNQSQENQKLDLVFESQTLLLKDDAAQKQVRVDKGQTQTVYFQVQSPEQMESGEHVFKISAKSQSLEDTVIQSIKITPNNTYETTSTANYTADKTAKEYVFLPEEVVREKGSLTINSSATLAVFLSDALNYLIQYPYGCTEQIGSKLNAIAIVKTGLNLPNLADKFKLEKVKYNDKEYSIDEIVEIGLAQLYDNQRYDGGFSLWRGGDSNYHASLQAAETLNNLSLAGYNINQNSLKRVADYLYQQITAKERLYNQRDNIILAAYTLSQLPDWDKRENLRKKVIEIANDDLFIKENISNASLAYLAILTTDKKNDFPLILKRKIFETLENRVDIDSRGAFLEPNQNLLWYYYETPVKDTALYLKALAKDKSKSPILDKIVRWILNSREKDGAWGSTNNTLAAIEAFTDFLKWKRETESNFVLGLQINDNLKDSFHFEPSTILNQFRKIIPLKDLKFGETNTVVFNKENVNLSANNFYYDMALKYYLPADQIAPRDEGFSIVREFFRLDDLENKNPVSEAKTGDVLRVRLQIMVPKSRHFATVEDYIPAGLEIVNLDLATEQKSLRLQEKELNNFEFRPTFKELRDDRVFLFTENLSPGIYEFNYYVRAIAKGDFLHLPALAFEMYFPENFGRTAGGRFLVE
ncbi:MAG: alpha-2-macroglobulin family protein [bacterium]|nr:alpha-2-macroglobulin family protein [bacterium]